MKSLL
ncbi:uncharacterized protein FFNC_15533 [Fusarium fujikuroi]